MLGFLAAAEGDVTGTCVFSTFPVFVTSDTSVSFSLAAFSVLVHGWEETEVAGWKTGMELLGSEIRGLTGGAGSASCGGGPSIAWTGGCSY